MAKKKETTGTSSEKIIRISYWRDKESKKFLTGERLMTTKAKAEKQAKAFVKESSFAKSFTIKEEDKNEKPRKKASIPLPEDDQIAKGEEPQ